MDGFATVVLSRLPLAEAVLRCWQWAFNPETLQGIFQQHRGRSYEGVLTFETIVQLVASALLEHRGSGNQAFERAAKADELPASKESVYGKLRRMPIPLSNGLLLAGTQRLAELLPARSRDASKIPRSLRQMTILFVDGKKIKQVPRLLKPARHVRGSVLGGKTLSALCWQNGLVVAMHAHPDGETSDAPLIPCLLAQLPDLLPDPRLYVLDRQFCDLVQPAQLTTRPGDHFLIRYNAKVHFFRDEKVPVRRGTTGDGNHYLEEWGWIGAAGNPRRCAVRRVTLQRQPLPGDDSPEPVILITDLLDADKYPAEDLLEAYRNRSGIERVFHKITDVFHLNNLISTTPEGTVFQFAFCMLLYNVIQLMTLHLDESQKIPAPTISQENIFNDVHRQLIAWSELVPVSDTVESLGALPTPGRLRDKLQRLLSVAWTDRWLKAPSKKRSDPHREQTEVTGKHTSMFRLIHEEKPPKSTRRRRK